MSGVSIRSATRDDVPEILRLIRALAEYEKLSAEVVATEAQLALHLFGDRPAAEVLLAETDGRCAGFALFFQNYSTFLARPGIYLEDLFVEPEKRGHGIGRRLLETIARLAVERGCGRFEWAVLDWNAPAIEFYKRMGARPLDEWTVFRLSGESLQRLGTGERETSR